jgi:O-antigen/teichoic acid export membrane protein
VSSSAPSTAEAPSEVSAGRLVRNTVANAAGGLVVAVIALAMTPFLLHHLGPERYGLWVLALTVTVAYGYGALGDLGLQQTLVREVAAARARGDREAVSRMVCSALALVVVTGAALAAILLFAVPRLLVVFNVPSGLRSEAAVVVAVLALQLVFDLPTLILSAVIEGAQHYAWFRVVEVGSRAVWALAAVPVVLLGGGLVELAVVSLVVSVIWLGVALVGARAAQPDLVVAPRMMDPGLARWLIPRAGGFMTLRVLSIVYRQMDRIILGVLASAVVVAEYDIVYKIHATAALMLSLAPSAVLPAASYLDAAGDPHRLRTMYLKGTSYAIAMVAPITLAAIVFARPLIELWVGVEYTHLTGATRLFLSYPILVSVHAIGLTMVVGLGRLRTVTRLSAAAIVLNLVLSVVLARRYGLIGVVWGTVVGYAVLWIPYLRTILRTFRVSGREFVAETIAPNIPGSIAQLAVGLALVGAVSESPSWLVLGAAASLSIGVSVATYLMVGLRAEDRRHLLATVRRN